MKIGIHHIPGSFSDRWIAYCEKKHINYKLVDCYATNIIDQLADCDAFMWHHHHMINKDTLFAKQLIFAIEQSGKKTFPNFKTCWHFDDKIAQKYLFEAFGAPLAPSYVFYSKKEAMDWIKTTTFPKVLKLRSGAGSANVRLVHSARQASKLIKQAFGKGFTQFDRIGHLKERIRRYREKKDGIIGVVKGLGRLVVPTEFAKMHQRERGYIYFQDFIPNNQYDIRVIVIGEKAFAIKRMVRTNDFRASGSGNILYGEENFPLGSVRLAFELTQKLQSQCAAFDFVYDASGTPMVVELSYGFSISVYDPCVGYWDPSLHFHKGSFIPQEWMVEMVAS
jgi:glutathione synthase/RimK-type ligase-like ATP-grasp enzyme